MAQERFICPTGEEVPMTTCLEKGCIMAEHFAIGRCLPLPTLRAAAEQREWTGTPSTTMLINGTRESYLKIVHDYAVNPEDLIWAIFGTGVHMALEKHAGNCFCEQRLADEYSTGAPDLYDYDSQILYDYKTYGSYKVAKVLGLYKEKTPIVDANGVQLKYKNGKPMWNEAWKIGRRKRHDLAYQLNDYRCKLEKHGMPVAMMVAQILTRDGGTFVAEGRGLTSRTETVVINKISDHWIQLYMKTKAQRLADALATNTLPPPCKPRETWDGMKCQRFCNVWDKCDIGIKARQ